MRTARRLLAVVLLAAAAYAAYRFGVENAESVSVHLLVAELGPFALWLALAGAFALGLALGAAALLYPAARHALTARRYRKAVASLEKELHELRSLPLAEEEPGEGGPAPAAAGARRRGARGSG